MNKIVGYLFVCVGILLVFFSLVSMYKVFVDRQPVAPVVQLADMNLQTQYGAMTVPMQNLNTLVNLGLFAVFMAFVLSVGAKLAGIGTQWLKNERIHDALLALKLTEIPDEEKLKKL